MNCSQSGWLWQLIDRVLGAPGLSVLSCDTKGWIRSMTASPSSSTLIFVQIALGRQGLWKRNISEGALSEMQTSKPRIKDIALNGRLDRKESINKRGNHISRSCKGFWKNKAVSEIIMHDQPNPQIKRP